MKQQQWKRINNIVDTALELAKEERDTYIQEQCKGDRQLRQEVTALIDAIEQSDTEGFLEDLSDSRQQLAQEVLNEDIEKKDAALIDTTIDRYELIELIGHGGMGSVFLAKRADDAYEQRVAIKVLHRGMHTPSNVARFRRERQILAKLNHPNIARLLDGGLTPEGLPYLVMEYVEGKSLYEYCNQHSFSIGERIQLFRSICRAIQHAHRNTVIHRDLKPSNILVTEEGEVKILDFGIAKLLDPENPGQSLYQTQTGARLLTLGYAAPEQIKNGAITTATDTYTLGIVFYELLCGTHPFDLEEKKLTEIENLIRTHSPSSPRKKFLQLQEDIQQKEARFRHTTPSSLIQSLKGDLDAIVLKALRKEPEERYDSIEQFLEDLRRHKQNRPIIARKDTLRYKTKKFIKRHTPALSVAAGFLLLIIGFTFFYTWQITEERNRAQMEADKAQKTLQYLVGVFQHADPNQPESSEVTAGQILENGTNYINNEVNDTDIKASLSNALGTIYQHLGKYEKAEPLLYEALKVNQKRYSEDHINLANSLYDWGGYNMTIGKHDSAEKYFTQSSAMYKRLGKKSEYADAIGELGWAFYLNGHYTKADSLLTEALEINRSIYGEESSEVAWDYQYLGWIKNGQGHYNQADSLFGRALVIRRAELGNSHRLVAQTLQSLGRVLYNKGDYEEADYKEKEALNIQRSIFENDHPDIASTLNILGLITMRQEDFDKAENYFREALQMRLKFYSQNHPDVLKSRNDLATIYFYREKYLKAAEIFKQVADANREVRGRFHPEVATSLNNRALALRNAGQKNKALETYRETLEIARKNYTRDHPKLLHFRKNTALLYEELNQFEKASELWLPNFQVHQQKNGLDHSDTKETLNHLINCYQKLNDLEKVEEYQALLDK